MARDLTSASTEDLLRLVSGPADEQVILQALSQLVTRYKTLAYNLALRICRGNRALADEVFQETFLRLFSWLRDREDGPPLHTFPGLLSVFVKRTAIDLMRREIRQSHSAPFEEALGVAAEEPDRDTSLYAWELLETLDSRMRAVVELTYFQGLSAVEIAERLRLTPANVRVLRFRALEAMRAREEKDQIADAVEPL